MDENGVVLALNEGSACITYTCKEHPFDTLECDVTVVSQGELKDPVTTASGVSTWDCVWLGKYWQDQDTNGDRKYDRNDEKTAIKWRILDIDDDGNALLLSDRLLDSCLFNDNANNKYKVEPWASCTLRSYLNSYDGTVNAAGNDYSSSGFLTEAFSEEEIEVIEEGTVVNDTNWFDWTSSGPDTEDKIFCLSMDESVNPGYGFVESYVVLTSGNYYADTADDPTRVAYDTSYSYTRTGASTIGQNKRKGNWLLRTQIGDSYYVSGISTTGKMSAKHTYVYSPGRFIRPALRINLTDNEDFWCYAGTVCSDGTMNEEEPRVKVKDVSLPDSETVMEKMSITLTPTIYPENATYKGVTWSSSDKNVAVVKDGVVTGVGPGYADITVVTDDGGWDAVCRVTVEPFVVKPPETTGDEKTVWDGIWFGSYPQSKGKTNGTYEEEPIKWRVLEMDDDGTVLLLSDKLLDAAPYNTEAAEVTWETSSLRAFLNGTGDYLTKGFVDSAFSASERKGIISSLLENENNPIYDDTEGGEDTEDLVFCLSVSEAMNPEYGFEVNDFISSKAYTEPDVTRKAFASQYAENALGLAAGSAGAWWLRSPGRYTSQAARVDNEGSIRAQGSAANDQATGIRPAIRLTLSDSSLWSFAGKIYSDGTKDEVQPEKKDEKDIAVRSIVLPGSEKVEEDGSITLRPVIYPFDAWDQTVEWSSSNDKVAVVDENGVVTGVGEGYADITAKTNDGGFEATCRVTVEKKPTVSVNGIKFTLSENNIFVGDTRELVPMITPADATDKSVSWRSTDESVAEVDEKGVVTGKTEGYAFIIARTNDGGLEAKCRVNVSERPAEVKHVNGVAVRAELTVVEGGTWTLTPVITPSDADDKTVTWSSSDDTIATVSSKGVVTGKKEGTAKITVKTNDGGHTATCTVSVVEPAGTGDVSKINKPRTSGGVSTWDCIWFGNYWQEDTNGDGYCFSKDTTVTEYEPDGYHTYKYYTDQDGNELYEFEGEAKTYLADKKQPVKWRVLNIDKNGNALLLADKLIDIVEPNESYADVTWETCTMRSYLNGYDGKQNLANYDFTGDNSFIYNAFSESERNKIITYDLTNPDNPVYGETKGGNDTQDKIFCLSLEEAMTAGYGFVKNEFSSSSYADTQDCTDDDPTRVAVTTKFTDDKPGYYAEVAGVSDWWWLRSLGKDSYYFSHVSDSGYVDAYGGSYGDMDDDIACIRPALCMNLSSSSSLWSYAGTVCSDG
ncbi:MAG: DUF6273 domain-containing protein, partial [Lachnospiraceae bacterium]|nr:DUF6273 domain-containing protein [Lachnospiraceae bacterium]